MVRRSPILGYNHNIGYRGLVFHVQTEDSGVDNPHVFTHLFHGGVILTTRKLDYDAGAANDAVKSLMQAQHKAIIKGLVHGEFDDKIDAYLGKHPDLEPRKQRGEDPQARPRAATAELVPGGLRAAEPVAVELAEAPTAAEAQAMEPDTSPARAETHRAPESLQPYPATAPQPQEPAPATVRSGPIRKGTTPIAPAPPPVPTRTMSGPGFRPPGPPPRTEQGGGPVNIIVGSRPSIPAVNPVAGSQPPAARPPVPAPAGARPAAPGPTVRGNVLVSQPPIMVDKNTRPAAPAASAPVRQPRIAPARTVREEPGEGLFEQNLISEKSLDEVILAYLSEDASDD